MTLSLCNCYRVFKLKSKAIILPWLDYFRCVIVERVQQTYNSPIESLNLFRGGQKKMHQNQWINPTTVLSLLSNCLVPFSLRLSLRGKTSHSKLIIERNITWIYGQNSTVWSLKWRFFVGILLTLRFVIEDFTDFNPDRLGTIIMDGKNEL